MKQKISVVLIGISGYGNKYVNLLLDQYENAFIKGVVDIHPERSEAFDRIQAEGIPVFQSLEAFYNKHTADLAVISTPIHLHAKQACEAMEHGSHVLCEKPATGDINDLDHMKKVQHATGKRIAIGFNLSYTDTVQELKSDIRQGAFGKPLCFKNIVLWPRTPAYYTRSAWAGKAFGPNGEKIMDSVANNATSHFLHHMYYLLGPEAEESARLKDVTAELYKANDIETFDTCAMRAHTLDGVEILYFASHAVQQVVQPIFHFKFEHATVIHDMNQGDGARIEARFADGTMKSYSTPNEHSFAKLQVCFEAIRGERERILCGLDAATPHVQTIDAMHRSVPDIPAFPPEMIHVEQHDKLVWVPELQETLVRCFNEEKLPSELNVPWSKAGKTMTL
ncbi:Gfo/Idh/MocA family oxidoreductase [Bacillaceae bacterium SIJ1]|uniref:Gfo/Idh/MocA family protein n=1 Tax=Litoribacterium kuwaitense TaxID=1398745 RepID=UPI0013EACDC3|nr:Gfo/Idh/MocA family oxidoreductase [Litoribacterium kuwaitense]NGP45180.1 Gfo/Idh/MocA family oxidoreductase [Litoribacterium kuwaitense]